ncbi:MAG: hypothetical protein PHX18_03735 [Candidatus Gastranaerophilales bacterium]|nr:hypothetical protein [Candidatus Gastranaerophilales bacterium]
MTDNSDKDTSIDSDNDVCCSKSSAILTFLVILIFAFFAFYMQAKYSDILVKSRFLKFYPSNTMVYKDFDSPKALKSFDVPFDTKDVKAFSWGAIKNTETTNNVLFILKNNTTEEEDTLIREKQGFYYFVNDEYTYISDSEIELELLKDRIIANKFEIFESKNIKYLVKNLEDKRNATFIILNSNYLNELTNMSLPARFLDKTAFSVTYNDEGFISDGVITFKDKKLVMAVWLKELLSIFNPETPFVEFFNENNIAAVIWVNNFDLFAKSFSFLRKNIGDNQYTTLLNLLEDTVNLNFEFDIAQNLKGDGVFYLFNQKKQLQPMLLLETKKDIATPVRKAFDSMQFQKNTKISQIEVNRQTVNVLSSKYLPYNLNFTNLNDEKFLIGHQAILEKYLTSQKSKIELPSDTDVFVYLNTKKIPKTYPLVDKILKDFSELKISLKVSGELTINIQGKYKPQEN